MGKSELIRCGISVEGSKTSIRTPDLGAKGNAVTMWDPDRVFDKGKVNSMGLSISVHGRVKVVFLCYTVALTAHGILRLSKVSATRSLLD